MLPVVRLSPARCISGDAANSIDGALMLFKRHRWSIDVVCRDPGESRDGDVRGPWCGCGS